MRRNVLLGFLVFVPLAVWGIGLAAQPSSGRRVTKVPMPTPRTEVAAAALEGKIYVIGGFGGPGGLVEVYDPASDSWTALAPMPTSRHGLGAAVVGGVIYVIGGGPRPGGSVSAANEAFIP